MTEVSRPFTLGPALLFAPADRPDRFEKAAERSDAVILDLEDAVAPAAKPDARENLVAHPLDPASTIIRVNPAGTADFADDLAAIAGTPYRTIMLAKTERAADVASVTALGPDCQVVALCETAAGVLAAEQIAATDGVVALMWGAEDLVASLGGSSSRFMDGRYRAVASHARSRVLLAAGAYGKAAIDSVFLDIADLDSLAAEAHDAVACGFTATACIHPSQVSVIRDAYRPSVDEADWARDVLAAALGEHGVFRFRGRMVDAPVLRHAEQVVRRTAAPHPAPPTRRPTARGE